jgi:hypothetical protein
VAPSLQNVMLPAELLEDPEAEQIYSEAVQDCVTHYRTIFLNLTEIFKKEIPQSDFKTEAGWENACRAKALDLSRGLLPAGSKTSLGMTVNGRELAHMLRKLLASPLGEVRAMAGRLHEEGVKVLPTLVRHVAPSEYRQKTAALAAEVWQIMKGEEPAFVPPVYQKPFDVRLFQYPSSERALVFDLAAWILYKTANTEGDWTWEGLRWHLGHIAYDRVLLLVTSYLHLRGNWDVPGRALEHAHCSAEILVDYGAWRDIQRHRMCPNCCRAGRPGWAIRCVRNCRGIGAGRSLPGRHAGRSSSRSASVKDHKHVYRIHD